MVLGNPKKRKRKVKRRPMTALQKKYFGKGRRKLKRKKKKGEVVIVATSNPRRSSMAKRRRRRRTRVISARSNPRRRRRHIHARRNPRRRRFIHARRNPRILAGGVGGFLSNSLIPAAIGAAGAIGVDAAIGNLPLPASMKTKTMMPIIRIVGALGIGYIAGMVLGEEAGEQAASGAIIVTVYQTVKSWLTQNVPSLKLARYVPMNRYLGRRRRRLGFIRRGRLAALPPRARLAAIRRMRRGGMKGMVGPIGVPRLGRTAASMPFKVRSQRGMGYIGPARTLGRYMNNGR